MISSRSPAPPDATSRLFQRKLPDISRQLQLPASVGLSTWELARPKRRISIHALQRTPADHADQQEDDRDHEQDVQESAKGVLGDDAKKPQDHQDDYQRDHGASRADDTSRSRRSPARPETSRSFRDLSRFRALRHDR